MYKGDTKNMKKYLFDMGRNDHNIFLAMNVAHNRAYETNKKEDWDEFYRIQDIYDQLHAHQISYRFAEVPWDLWQKAYKIAQGAIHYRAQCNEER